MPPVAVFDRANPDRNHSALNWREELRAERFRLTPDVAHEVKMPERGLYQLCENCRRPTRESVWIVRCGPCGLDHLAPRLTLFSGCEHCGLAEGATTRLREHAERVH